MPVRPDDYDDIVGRINKKYEGDIRRGDDYQHSPRIPTGSPELDAAMGGGVPIGRWTRFYGGYHSTKTLRALSVAREAQKMGLLVAYYNAEKQYDPKFAAERIGVNVEELTVVEGTTVEEIGEKMESLFGVVHLHILDSISVCVSEDELNADVRDWRPGIAARAWGKVFRRLNERFDHVENTVLMIDQVRTNFKTGGEEAPGGRIIEHQSSMTVHFKKGSWLFRDPETLLLDEKAKQEKNPSSGQIEPSGMEIKARVEKSRVCRPFRTATMRLDFESLQFDEVYELVKAAKHYGVVRSSGRYYYYTPPGSEQEIRFDSTSDFRAFVQSDLTFQQEVRDVMMDAANR